MDLSQVADQYLGQQSGIDLTGAGEFTRLVHEFTGSEQLTTPLVATIFWQSFMSSPAFPRELARLGASPTAIVRGEAYVVRHGNGWQHDLVVFDPGLGKGEPLANPDVHATEDELLQGWEISSELWQRWYRDSSARGTNWYHPNLAVEARSAQPYGLLVAPPPEALYTASWPSPRLGVELTAGAGPVCSVGLYATDQARRAGVTTALHALKGASSVFVDGQAGTVVSDDPISDSCFIQLASPPSTTLNPTSGPLTGVTPRAHESVTFEKSGAGPVNTIVIGWSPELPLVIPQSQSKILTMPDTSLGDSGAALIDGSDKVLGFAFYRTGFADQVEFAAWIWAESVFNAHRLS